MVLRRTRSAAACAGVACLLLPASGAAVGVQSTETIVELRVHGNQSISDTEVRALAGVAVGDRVGAGIAAEVERRLLDSGRFDSVEARKRYRSLVATDEIALVVVVRERAGSSSRNPLARLLGPVGRRTLFLPILDYAEGYGFSYGVRASVVDVFGTDSRLSVPATWGGTKRVALEVDQRFETGLGLFHRLQAGVSLLGRENPHFRTDEDRTELWVQVDRRLPARSRVGARVGWADVRFGVFEDKLASYRLSFDVDTREDATFPRNAVFARAGFEWLNVLGRGVVGRPSYEIRAYRGLFGQAVLAVRGLYQGADAPVPPYEQALLGGGSTLRGWSTGQLAADKLAAASVELRVPFNSPLSIGRTGATVFFDAGTVYEAGQSLVDATFRRGAGAGLFLQVPLIHLRLDVAHDFIDAVRVHVAAEVGF